MSAHHSTRNQLDQVGASLPAWLIALLLSLALAGCFAATAEWDDAAVNVDAVAAALPAWSLAQHGTTDLSFVDIYNPWVAAGPNGTFSNRPPGVYLPAVPAYLLLGDAQSFSTDPATLTAVLLTAAAMGVLYLVLRCVTEPNHALVATVVIAFGTATWPISSTQLWAHGPGQLAVAAGMLALASGRYVLAGTAFAGGILIRPVTAIFPGVVGLGALIRDRRRGLKAFFIIAVTAVVAVVALLAYNQEVFGSLSISGGYPSAFAERLVTMQWGDFAINLARMFFLLPNGLLFWSPVIGVASLAAYETRRKAPSWSKIAAVAAILYLVVHARMNRASGGLPFNYRYPLEPIVVAAPLLVVGASQWFRQGSWRRTAVVVAAGVSIALQGLFLFTISCVPQDADTVLCRLGGF